MKITILQNNRNIFGVPYEFIGYTDALTLVHISNSSFKDHQEERRQTKGMQYWTYILENEDLPDGE